MVWASKRVTLTPSLVPNSNFGNGSETEYTVHASWVTDGSNILLKYMFESFPGEREEDLGIENEDYVKYNNKIYVQSKTYTQSIFSAGQAFRLKDIEGKTELTENALHLNSTTNILEPIDNTNSDHWEKQYLLYDRNRYSLSFDMMGGVQVANYTGILSEQNITSLEPANPTRAGYQFKGWHEDRECNKKYDFKDAVMPNRNLELYAKWEPIGLIASFYDQDGGTLLGEQNVAVRGNVISPVSGDSYYLEIGMAYPNLGIFEGWYHTLYNGLVVPFDFSNAIQKNVVLYGLYQTDGFKVTYDKAGGIGTEPVDDETYRLNAGAMVKEASLTKGNFVLAGWQEKDKTGIIYYPGSTIQMYGHVRFEAVYADPASLTNLIYDSNFGTPSEKITDRVIEGREYALRDSQTFQRTGYVLKGWSQNAADTVPQYKCGESYLIPAGGNTLYAIWEEIQYFDVEFAIRDADVGKGKILTQNKFRVEKDSLSVSAIPPASRPQVEIIPDADNQIKYRFTGWDALPEYITSDVVVYANFEGIKDGGGSGGNGTGKPTIKDGTNEKDKNHSEEKNKEEIPLIPELAAAHSIILLFPLAIAFFVFRKRQDWS